MVKLSEASVFEGANLPLTIGEVTIDALPHAHLTCVMPFDASFDQVSEGLRAEIGLDLSKIGRWHERNGARVIWAGLDQWLIETAEPLDRPLRAAASNQSDGWARLKIKGQGACDLMRRLCPLDVVQMMPGHVARTETEHMMSIVIAVEGGFEVWVMRSFAQTLLHGVKQAATHVARIKALRS